MQTTRSTVIRLLTTSRKSALDTAASELTATDAGASGHQETPEGVPKARLRG
ncbi:hypothetical protein [Haladaptatus caseinilyticus]|uniref:hypothetical protein n=1 Tax=Haladaptatus caseinilyticus TaxID=2993314 RepID=UPI00224AAC16|nr:hypothetical protein [Haladaptatus caseinilyticus]